MTDQDNIELKEEEKEEDKKRPFWLRFIFFLGRLFRRVVVWSILAILLLSIGIVVLSQTESFRRWAAPHIQDIINDQLIGKIEFSDFEINIFKGLVFHDVRVLAAGDTVLATQKITLGYDIERLFTNEIYVTNLTIETPRIKILRSIDSIWNVSKIAKPSTDTTPANPFTWKIHAFDIAIQGGTITMYDSTSRHDTTGALDFSHLHLWNVNLAFSADASIAKKDFSLLLNKLSFEEASGLSLKELSCKVALNKQGIDLKNLKFITSDTKLDLEAHADSLNIFEGDVGDNFSKAPLSIELNADSLDTKDLLRFLPHAGLLGTYKLSIVANGKLPLLSIQKLLVESQYSKISATGKLRHLDKPEKLAFQASLEKSFVNYNELQANAQSLYLPILDFLGTVRIQKASINAVPTDSIAIYADAKTASGNVDGFLTLFLRDTLGYHGNLKAENINLSKIAHNTILESSINAQIDINGKGIMLNELDAFARIESLNSTLAGRHWRKAYFSGGSHGQGIVNFDSLFVDVADGILEPDSLAFDPFAENKPAQFFTATGMVDLRNMRIPQYKITGNFEHFPLVKMTDISSLPRTISASFRLNGSGFHPDSLEGKYHFNFKELTFPDRTFMPWKLNLDISRNYLTNERLIEIKSPIIRGTVEGMFTIDDLSKECSSQGIYIADFLQQKIPILTASSTKDREQKLAIAHTFVHPAHPINVRFNLDILDLSPVNVLLGKDLSLDIKAKLKGSITANSTISTSEITEFTIDKSRINTSGTSIVTDKIQFTSKVNIQHSENNSELRSFQFSTLCDSTITINDALLYRPAIKLDYNAGTMALSAKGVFNNEFSGNVVGSITFQDTVAHFKLDTLTFGFGGMDWNSYKTSIGSFTPHGIDISRLEMHRKNAERIELSGLISNEQFQNFTVKLHEFPLRELTKFQFIDEDTKQLLKTLDGEATEVSIGLNGTYLKPIITCTGQFDNLAYNGIIIGNQTLQFKHQDSVIIGSIDIVNPKISGAPKVLQIGIEQLPLNCAFANIKDRWSKTEPLIITGKASKLSMGVLAPFIPGITKLQGLADAEITVEGIAPNIHYGGTAALSAANFVVQSTNIRYFADGKMSLKNNEVTIENMSLKNDEVRDLRGGKANINGRVLLKDFNIDSLDLSIRSPKILLLSSASAATSPTLYGKFVISTGHDPLHFFGTLEKPFLRGDVNIEDASLVFPPDKQLKVSASTFRYTVDTSNGKFKMVVNKINPKDTLQPERTTPIASTALDLADKNAKKRRGPGINELIDYDVYVKIPGNFGLKMILGQFDQLEAIIGPKDRTVPLHYIQPPLGGPKLYGDIIVKEGSKYKFFKVFDASGSLEFNTGAIDNPELNIFAKYKGQRNKDNVRQNYVVNLSISGSKNVPKVGINYQIEGLYAMGDSAKVRSDAILMLLFGKTQDELRPQTGTGGAQLNLTNELSNGVSGVASNQLSSLLQGTGVFTDAQIDFVGGIQDWSQARLSLSGQLFGNVSWRVGGTLGDVSNNSQISVDVPLDFLHNVIGDYDLLNNFVLQLTKTINPTSTSSTNRQQYDWEIKPGFRYSF